MPDLLDSASNLHAALLRREFSARDLIGSTLAAIGRLDPAVNAIVQKDAASAWRGASDSDVRAVARLRRAGAILLGKTNVPIFTGDFQTSTAFTGRPITLGTKAFPQVGPRAGPRRPSPPA